MKKELEMVERFHRAFGVCLNEAPTLDIPAQIHELRLRILREEVEEYGEELARGGDAAQRLQAVAKELADIAYVLFGTVITHGLQEQFERVFEEVHRSNMSKLDAQGRPVCRADGKVLKSEFYREPDLTFLTSGKK